MARTSRLTASLTLLFLAALLLSSMPAAAEMRKIAPLKFKPMFHDQDVTRTPGWVGAPTGGPTQGSLMAPVRIPRGATIDGVSVYYTGNGVGAMQVYLGYIDTAAAATDMYLVAIGSVTGSTSTPLQASIPLVGMADKVSRPGYRYAVWVHCPPGYLLWEARVLYTP